MAIEKKLRYIITGSGLNVPYINTMYFDLNTVNLGKHERAWSENGRDKLDGREEKPFHDMIPGYKVFSTRIVRYPDNHLPDPNNPYWTRKCAIEGAQACWVEVGLFHERHDGYNFNGTIVKVRWTKMTTSGKWSTSEWFTGGLNWWIDWSDELVGLMNKDKVSQYLGHWENLGNDIGYFIDLFLGICRCNGYYHVGWINLTQSNPYVTRVNDPWVDSYGTPYTTKVFAYGGGLLSIEANLGNITNIEAVCTYILTHGNLPEFPYIDSEEGGGDGSQDNINDDIPIPPPYEDIWTQINAHGMIGVYRITKSASAQLVNYLYNDNVIAILLKQMFSSPLDAIIDYFYLPLRIKDVSSTKVFIGGHNTNISAEKPNHIFQDFDCGIVNLDEYYGTFLDYAPYTKLYIYLPFVGVHQLNVNYYMGSQIHVLYRVNVIDGSFTVYIESQQRTQWGIRKQVINSFTGNMAYKIPLTQITSTMLSQTFLNTIAGVQGGAYQIAAGLPQTMNNFSNPDFKGPKIGGMGSLQAAMAVGAGNMAMAGLMGGFDCDSVTQHSSNLGYNGIMYPYLIIDRPIQQVPTIFGRNNGYPSFMGRKIDSLSGFTKVLSCHIDSIENATSIEKDMILDILTNGFIA